MGHDIFISYASQDRTVGDAVCANLETRDIKCWIAPRDVLPGISWAEAVFDALNQSRIMVLVFSASANDSPQVMREVERAVSKGIPIIPFRIENVTPSRAMEFFVSSPHWVDALGPSFEKHLDRLADTIQILLDEVTINKPKVSIIQGDITKQGTDAIVNAANSSLMGGGGVDGAIHRAGGSAILEECKKIVAKQGRLPTGKAVITTGGKLKAKYVIHTVGPVWHGGSENEAEFLRSAYYECLKLATEHKLTSISFPSISTGAYGYPVGKAARIAIGTVVSFLQEQATSLKKVVFVTFDSRTSESYTSALQGVVQESLVAHDAAFRVRMPDLTLEPGVQALPPATVMKQIFISHVEEDRKEAEEIARGLEEAGYTTCYYERDFDMTRHYLEVSAEYINGAGVIIVLMSPDALKSEQLKLEVLMAHEFHKPFILLLHKQTYIEYQQRRPNWALALISCNAQNIPQEGVRVVLSQVINSIKKLGLYPTC